jgi:hypothetical protein
MKKLILTALAIMTLGISSRASWFNNDAAEDMERSRRLYAENQLAEEQEANGNLGIAVVVLAVAATAALSIGCAIGSKCRKAATNDH